MGVMLFVLFLASGPSLRAQTAGSKEYQVKAVFLFNFTQFIKWPSSAFTSAQEPFTIGILGDDPFGPFLDQTVKGEKVDGHPIVVRRYHGLKEIKKCHLLFVSNSEFDKIHGIFTELEGRSVLTVGDKEGFVRGGGVVRFVTRENKIRLRVGLEAAKDAHLVISSKILRLAEIVKREKK